MATAANADDLSLVAEIRRAATDLFFTCTGEVGKKQNRRNRGLL